MFYADLKTNREAASPRRRSNLRGRVDRIFRCRTGFVALDGLLACVHGRNPVLLRVLNRPEMALHTNGSEVDIRAYVIARSISGWTQSEAGRRFRDGFLGLAKTRANLGVSFWEFRGYRLRAAGASLVPALRDLARLRATA